MKSFFKKAGIGVVIIFALIGVVCTTVFIGMRFGLLNVRGSIAERNAFFADAMAASSVSSMSTTTIHMLNGTLNATPCVDGSNMVCEWEATPEWAVVEAGLQKDSAIIERVSKETGVSRRMIAAVVIPEQIRFFTSNREVFKRWFEPMKILGSLSQFSLGVSGIKQETAVQIETYAHDTTSPLYPGAGMSDLIAYTTDGDHARELYNRLTDDKDHYYSYLYTALYIKEIQAQWRNAGYDISENPEVIVTLFNIGFNKSNPNPHPVAGGAEIELGGKTYTYGELGAYFYYGERLTDAFPR